MTKYIARLYDKNDKFIEEINVPHCYPFIETPVVPLARLSDGKLLSKEASYVQSRTFRLNREVWFHVEPDGYVKRVRYDEVDEE